MHWYRVVALISVLIVSVGALAQGRDAFDLHAASFQLLTLDSVKKELGVTQAQRAKMNKHADAHSAVVDRLIKAQKDSKDPRKSAEKLAPQAQASMKRLNDLVLGELSAAQLKRLREISLQQVGPSALGDTVVAKKVGMTDAQVKQLRKVYETAAEQAAKIQKSAMDKVFAGMPKERPKDPKKAKEVYDEGMRRAKVEGDRVKPILTQIAKGADTKALAVLTAAQRQAWTALQGKPFKFS